MKMVYILWYWNQDIFFTQCSLSNCWHTKLNFQDIVDLL